MCVCAYVCVCNRKLEHVCREGGGGGKRINVGGMGDFRVLYNCFCAFVCMCVRACVSALACICV